MTQSTVATGDTAEAQETVAVRQVVVRPVRAAPRAYLSANHMEALFGAGHKLTPVWNGLLGEMLCLERVTVSAGNKKESRVRVVAGTFPATQIALTHTALHLLDLRGAPVFGQEGAVGAALSGPKGAVVLGSGVVRAAPRLILPDTVARKVGVKVGQLVELSLPSVGEALEGAIAVEVRSDLREGVVVLDTSVGDRLLETASLTVKLGQPRHG